MTSKARTTEDDGKVTKVDPAADTTEPAATRDGEWKEIDLGDGSIESRLANAEAALRLHGLMP